MSRVIKFRAWDSLRNEYLSAGKVMIQVLAGKLPKTPEGLHLDTSSFMCADGRMTLEQFTGLTDKKGVEIYEGDIVSQHAEWNETTHFNGGYSDSESCETETVGVVKIYPSKGAAITKCKKLDIIACDGEWEKAWDCNVRSCRATVIGNVHQNPELIGK